MTTVLLSSGGLDSMVLAASHSCDVHLTVNYGQEQVRELRAAADIARHFGVEHVEVSCRLPRERVGDVVPNRNAVLINLAASVAMARGGGTVLIGCNADDHDGFPDCRPPFLRAVNRALDVAGTGVRVVAPLAKLSKAQIGARAARLHAPTHLAWSCYHPHGKPSDPSPCGTCNACEGRTRAGV